MIKKPEFRPKRRKVGSWTVVISTGNGPDSHVGDFDAEEVAVRWIAANSKNWPTRADKSK
jgi:hypothetical protein